MLRRAAEFMQKQVITIGPAATLDELSLLLEDEHIHGVPVVDGDGLPIGVVSRSDLAAAGDGSAAAAAPTPTFYMVAADEIDWQGAKVPPAAPHRPEVTVADIMSRRLIHAPPDATAGQVARIMVRERVHRVLIIDRGRLRGLVSTSDLLRCLARYEQQLQRGPAERAAPARPPRSAKARGGKTRKAKARTAKARTAKKGARGRTAAVPRKKKRAARRSRR